MSVHVHGVELLHLFLTGLLLHVLKHLISDVLWKDGEQQTFLRRANTHTDRGHHTQLPITDRGYISVNS